MEVTPPSPHQRELFLQPGTCYGHQLTTSKRNFPIKPEKRECAYTCMYGYLHVTYVSLQWSKLKHVESWDLKHVMMCECHGLMHV